MTDPIITEILQHITVLNDDYTKMSVSIAILQTQMETIVWWMRAMGVAVIGMLVTNIGQLLIMRKNGHK